MDDREFRDFGKAMVDYIADYLENLRDRNVLPNVEPGYLSKLLPTEAPQKPEAWQEVMKDVERVIMPGITHWHSPYFHAYYPTANSYPAIVGELLSAGIGCIGFSWISSPACTELEVITLNWLGKLLGIPEEFLNSSPGPGGGVIEGSASEATLVALLAAREKTVCRVKEEHPDWDERIIRAKLIAYTSDQSNSSVEKAGRLGAMPMRLLPTDEKCSLRGPALLEAIEKDIAEGLIPCYVVGTLGTTPTCAFDNLEELGPICKEHKIWLHVDAAYAGAAFACPEYRYLMAGVHMADSFNFNPHKWMLVNFDCSVLWIKNSRYLTDAFNVERIYLAYNKQGIAPDFRHWQIPLGRRFRALKVWFVLRTYGVEGIQKYIRNSIALTRRFEEHVMADDRFELVLDTAMTLVCFKLKGDESLTKLLIDRLTSRRLIYVIPGTYRGKLLMRFVVCSRLTTEEDIDFSWNEISTQATEILRSQKAIKTNGEIISDKSPGEIVSRIQDIEMEMKKEAKSFNIN